MVEFKKKINLKKIFNVRIKKRNKVMKLNRLLSPTIYSKTCEFFKKMQWEWRIFNVLHRLFFKYLKKLREVIFLATRQHFHRGHIIRGKSLSNFFHFSTILCQDKKRILIQICLRKPAIDLTDLVRNISLRKMKSC